MRITHYIRREVYKPTAAIVGVLWTFLFCQELLVGLSRASRGDMPLHFLWPLLALHLPHFLALIFPLAVSLGVLWGLSRLYTEGEMTAAFVAGLRQEDIQAIMAPWIVGSAVFLLVGTTWWLPTLAHWHDHLLLQAQSKRSLALVQPGRFYGYADGVVFLGSIDAQGSRWQDIFIAKGNPGAGDFSLLRARAGQWTQREADQVMQLDSGVHIQGPAADRDKNLLFFERAWVKIPQAFVGGLPQLHGKNTRALWKEASVSAWAELLMRFSRPMVLLQLAFWAINLAALPPKASRMRPVVYLLCGFFLYDQGLLIVRMLAEKGQVPLWSLAVWHAVFWLVFHFPRSHTIR